MLQYFQPWSGPTIPNPVPGGWAYTFNGQNIGPPFVLPTIERSTAKNQIDSDKGASGFAEISEGMGSQLITGIGPLWISGGRLTVELKFTHSYLQAQGYQVNRYGLEQALNDFDQAVVLGGLGNLMDIPGAGLVNKATGTPITWRRTQAIMRGSPDKTDLSADYALINVVFEMPTGVWANSDGSQSTLLIGASG